MVTGPKEDIALIFKRALPVDAKISVVRRGVTDSWLVFVRFPFFRFIDFDRLLELIDHLNFNGYMLTGISHSRRGLVFQVKEDRLA